LLRARFTRPDIVLSQEELEALPHLDADFLLIQDASGKTLFAYPAVRGMEEEPLYPGSHLKWINLDNGDRELGIAVKQTHVSADGGIRVAELGCRFNISIAESGGSNPIVVNIFRPEDGGFRQIYSSEPSMQYIVPPEAVSALYDETAKYFILDEDWTDNSPNKHSLLLPIRDGQGALRAVYVISALMLPFDGRLPSSTTLFWSFFIIGAVLSGCIGYALAKRLVRPIKKLTEGVRSIAAGNLGQRVAVQGNDEISELSAGFNLMVGQLEIMRHESRQSALRERSRMLGEIALGFAHEIRNPLMVIKTSAEVVHSTLKDKPRPAKLLGFVVEEVGRIDRLITEFLSFAKPAPLSMEYFHLYDLVKEITEISAAEFARRKIRCTLTDETGFKPGNGDRVIGERSKIHQVVLNLILNAMDAMPDGGDLSLRLYNADSPQNGCADSPEATARVCLEVKDTGVGIAEDILPTIHMPFISTKENGLGLGLATAYATIEEHGGSIRCASKPGEGSVFTICLNG
jgi:signal transduction histidine kinase